MFTVFVPAVASAAVGCRVMDEFVCSDVSETVLGVMGIPPSAHISQTDAEDKIPSFTMIFSSLLVPLIGIVAEPDPDTVWASPERGFVPVCQILVPS